MAILPLENRISTTQKGILYMLAASFFFAAMGALVKIASRSLPFFEVAFFRSFLAFIVLAGITQATGRSVKLTNWGAMVFRSASGCIALICYFFAISRIHLADAVLLNYTSPLFTVLFAALLLGEKMTRRLGVFLMLSLLGVILVLKPTGAILNLGGAVGLTSGLLAAIAYIQVRKLNETETPWTIVYYFVLFSSLISAPFLLYQFVMPTPQTFLVLMGVAMAGLVAQLCMTASYRYATASVGSITSLTTVLIAAIIGMLFFNEHPDALAIAGGLLILLSSFGLSSR